MSVVGFRMLEQPVFTQNIGPAPVGGLFGKPASTEARQNLDFTVALAQAFDSVVPPAVGARIPLNRPQQDGLSLLGMGAVDFVRTRARTQLAGSAFSTVRYFRGIDKVSTLGNSAALGATFT